MSYDLSFIRGDSGDVEVTVNINGDPSYPYDLTSVSEIIFNVKRSTDPADAPVISKLMSTGDITRLVPMSNGQYIVHLNPADTLLMAQMGTYWVDSRITDPSGTYTVVQATSETLGQLAQG